MSLLGRSFDAALTLVGAVAWSFAAYVIVSRFVSPGAGALIGLALLVSTLAVGVATFLEESRMQSLSAGVCPRCRGGVSAEHRHRRWDAFRSDWQPPAMNWECRACGYQHSETWACPACPEPH